MRVRGVCLAICACLLLASCEQFGGVSPPPDIQSPPEPRPITEEPSAESQDLAAYYRRFEASQRSSGFLRADGGGPDAPYDAATLARDFEAIAFSREFSDVDGALVSQKGESILKRWHVPVLIEPVFGPDVPDAQRSDDTNSIRRFSLRLSKATGHPVSMVQRGGNFRVLIVAEDQRRVIGPTLIRMLPEIRQREIDVIQSLERSTYCVVITSDPGNDGVLKRAVAIIRAELPPLLRLSCIHEEIAQGLGLANDSPAARPSIFNDNDEFGLLTLMDEKMLAMLYDPALEPGMTAEMARPIVQELAATLAAPTF